MSSNCRRQCAAILFVARQFPGRRPEAVATVVLDRVVGLYMLFVMASVAILVTGQLHNSDETVRLISRGALVASSAGAVGILVLLIPGVTQGTQTQLRFLPVPHTDFIFSAFAEEHGFVGVVVALGLYFLLLMQVVQNAQTAPDRAGMYICMGVAMLLLFHVLVNVGMVVGYMPVTGIPLPLMSSGGSNTFSVFMMLGLVNNVRLRRFVS